MFSGRQIVRALNGRGVTVYLDRRGNVSCKLNNNAGHHLHGSLQGIEAGNIFIWMQQEPQAGRVKEYLLSLPPMCGTTPFGHNSTCFAKAAHCVSHRRIQNKKILVDYWYYCESHLPPAEKLAQLRQRKESL